MRNENTAARTARLGLRDRIRTNRQPDGSLSAKEVGLLLEDLDRELGEAHDAPAPGTSDSRIDPHPPQGGNPGAGGSRDSADPGAGVDLTPGRDALAGTPPSKGEDPGLPTGGPVADNTPGPEEKGQDPAIGAPTPRNPEGTPGAPAVSNSAPAGRRGAPVVPAPPAPKK